MFALGGEEEHRRGEAFRPDFPHEIEPRQPWQHHIHQQRVEAAREGAIEPPGPRVRPLGVEAGGAHAVEQLPGGLGFVFDDQDAHGTIL